MWPGSMRLRGERPHSDQSSRPRNSLGLGRMVRRSDWGGGWAEMQEVHPPWARGPGTYGPLGLSPLREGEGLEGTLESRGLGAPEMGDANTGGWVQSVGEVLILLPAAASPGIAVCCTGSRSPEHKVRLEPVKPGTHMPLSAPQGWSLRP